MAVIIVLKCVRSHCSLCDGMNNGAKRKGVAVSRTPHTHTHTRNEAIKVFVLLRLPVSESETEIAQRQEIYLYTLFSFDAYMHRDVLTLRLIGSCIWHR